MEEKNRVPVWHKYTLTLQEASEYFGIGYKKLQNLCREKYTADFILWNGNRAQIKREMFEKYIDEKLNVI